MSNEVEFSRIDDPNEFPKITTINLRFRWLAKLTIKVLKFLGFDAYYEPWINK